MSGWSPQRGGTCPILLIGSWQLCKCVFIITFSSGSSPSSNVAASLISALMASKGGVAANIPGTDSVLNSIATSLDRWTGFWSSPLFTSTHLVLMIFHPRRSASFLGIFLLIKCIKAFYNLEPEKLPITGKFEKCKLSNNNFCFSVLNCEASDVKIV